MSATIVTQPTDFLGPINSYAKFSVVATGTGLTYMWQSNAGGSWADTSFTTSQTPELSLKITQDRSGRSYRCAITDANNDVVYSDAATLHVSKLVDSTQLDANLTSVANAIRAKSGGSSQLAFPNGFVSEIGNIPTGGTGPQWTLIGQSTHNLPEYTDTTNLETTDTGINAGATDYAYMLAIITCDTAIESSSEWGMTVQLIGRNAAGNNNIKSGTTLAVQQVGTATLSHAAMSHANEMFSNTWGVMVANAQTNIKITRKAVSVCPKMRAGTYTVKVYGLSSL